MERLLGIFAWKLPNNSDLNSGHKMTSKLVRFFGSFPFVPVRGGGGAKQILCAHYAGEGGHKRKRSGLSGE